VSALAVLALLQADPTASVAVAKGATQPSLALDADLGCYVAFFRNGNVELAVSTDGGKTWGEPALAIDAQGKAGGSNQRGPRLSLDSRKRLYLTCPLALEPNAMRPDLYAACSTDGGKTFSKPVRVNEPAGSLRDALHDSQAAPSGDLHVAWLDGRAAELPPAVYYCKVADQAKKPGKNVQVAPGASERAAPSIALDARGAPFVAFFDGPRKFDEKKNRQVLLAASSGPSSFKTSPLSREDTGLPYCPGEAPALGVGRDAKFVAAAWVDLRMGPEDRNVFWTLGDPAKLPLESPVHEDRRFYQGHPSLAVDAAGTAWCCWEDAREGVQRVFFASSSYKGNFRVGAPAEERGAFPSVAAAGKRAAVAYENGQGVSFAVLAAP